MTSQHRPFSVMGLDHTPGLQSFFHRHAKREELANTDFRLLSNCCPGILVHAKPSEDQEPKFVRTMTDSDLTELCDRFDASWQDERPLQIEDLLDKVTGAQRNDLLLKLLEIEFEHHMRRGETPTVKNYNERFPKQASLVTEAVLTAKDRVGQPSEDVPVTTAPVKEVTEPLEMSRRVIGQYKLLQQIGEGGMGTVFLAEQTHPVHRRVALKVVKSGLDRKEVLSRFEAERQALAMRSSQYRQSARRGQHG